MIYMETEDDSYLIPESQHAPEGLELLLANFHRRLGDLSVGCVARIENIHQVEDAKWNVNEVVQRHDSLQS
jgi:hypothetical protein